VEQQRADIIKLPVGGCLVEQSVLISEVQAHERMRASLQSFAVHFSQKRFARRTAHDPDYLPRLHAGGIVNQHVS
jgi:hypothetical protein